MTSKDTENILPRENVAKRRKSQRTEKKLDFAMTGNSSDNATHNSCSANNLTPLAAYNSCGRSSTETNSLLASRSRLGSSSFSSFSSESTQRQLSGLPAYIVDIPPIPNLHGLGGGGGCDDHKENRGTSKSLSSRSRSASTSTSLSTSTPEAIRSFKAIRRSSSVDLSNL